MRILVVDHNPAFSDVLKVGLKAVGHNVEVYPTAAEALAALGREEFALALVEYTVDGRQFLYGYKAVDPLLSAVILTSLPTQETAVEFLKGGASALALDYIVKPAPDLLRQLSAIIDTHFARVTLGEWMVERKLRRVTFRGAPLDLTPTEYALMVYFMLHPYEEVVHEDLWLAARGEQVTHATAVLKVRTAVSRLRDKLEEIAGREVVQNRRESGFRFLPEPVGAARTVG